MKIIKKLKKQPKWVSWAILDDQNSIIGMTGTYARPDLPSSMKRNIPIHDPLSVNEYNKYKLKEMFVIQYAHVVFELRFQIDGSWQGNSTSGFSFHCVDTGIKYDMGRTSIEELLRGIQEGKIKCENGALVGLFTLKKQGDSVHLMPYLGQ
jgi:hypothetical protein